MEKAGGARVNQRVWIRAEQVYGEVISEMTYGAVVRYVDRGIEFIEMLDEEDYEVVEDDE